MTRPLASLSAWVLSEGHVGMENQALGLAEALGVGTAVKRLWPRAPWSWLPPRLWLWGTHAPGPRGDRLDPPWPDLVISCGKRAAAAAAAVKRASGGATAIVHVQTPPLSLSTFDLVVVPAHDGTSGTNVHVTDAAVHRVTPGQIAAAAARFAPGVAHLPAPRAAVLVGGSNNRYRLTSGIMRRVAGQLAALARDRGIGLLVTPSRRTGAENEAILREALADVPAIVWDGNDENPYFAWLGLADWILVTCDSVSMTSEALSTGKPVYVIGLDGHSRRIEDFHRRMRDAGRTRPFDGVLESWSYVPPDDTARAAGAVRDMLARRGKI
jgi:hypothetical protein